MIVIKTDCGSNCNGLGEADSNRDRYNDGCGDDYG